MMGDNYISLENYEMLKALYDFKATYAKTLSFRENEHFILHQTNTKQRNWWQVVNSMGQLGYIPSNYVTTVKVQPQFLTDYLDECIQKLQSESMNLGSAFPAEREDLLLRLQEKKRQAELSKKVKKQAPMPPDFSTSTLTKDATNQIIRDNSDDGVRSAPSNTSYTTAQTTLHHNTDQVEAQLIAQCRRMTVNDQRRQLPRQSLSDTGHGSHLEPVQTKKSDSQNEINNLGNSSLLKTSSSTSCEINSKAAYQLLDQVRRNTQLSHEMSKVAVAVVVSGLQELLPASLSHYFAAVLNQLQVPLTASKMSIEETHDANRLKVIFTELTSCKEDSQQRSWMLYEDEPVIVEYIKELTSILTNADANVSRHVLRSDQYNGVTTLIQYYQMEPRWTIRQLLLQSFGVMCSLDAVILTIMLNSILPMELASDMRTYPRNVPRLNYSSLLLTMIFSMGEPMPVTHLEQLGTDFIAFLLDLIENPPDTDMDDQIPELFLNLVLSYNLQFTTSENMVLNALKQRTVAKTFTEKILLLLNREGEICRARLKFMLAIIWPFTVNDVSFNLLILIEDPVRIFDHQPAPPHSVLKLFVDLFSNSTTASLFYTNDIKVLIDIIVRQLFDISPGVKKRRQYLELCRRVLRTESYNEHRHRCDDVLKSFTRIFCEELPESRADQKLVREISNEFPHLFKM
ncbi:NCK-interacting protein with SH3 domain isoform X2 [Athalia rosae]|uniref:NCK-interacting protein with SH3 domain isoform X2 n=1 Tax=Athalia rosae TaxID=37344 RepID=UPI002033E883|nr:NCK-interacting protein with SH3 domain isoform X2 [Athalia rosae]